MQINIKELEEQFGKSISEFNVVDWWIYSQKLQFHHMEENSYYGMGRRTKLVWS